MISSEHQISNDKESLRKLLRRYRYDGYGSKGFIHGLQKDLIQNCVGARSSTRYSGWKVVFELLKIDNKYALSVTDEGTTGLLGGVYNNQQVAELSENNRLDESQGLSRFLHQYFSKGNTGPGSEGQGKGLFHLLSKDYDVIFDSLRNEGKENESYVAGRKYMDGNALKNTLIYPDDPEKPECEENKKLFKKLTNNSLSPLTKQGTRVIIKNIGVNDVVKDIYDQSIKGDSFDENGGHSFIQIYRNSFDNIIDKECVLSLKNMILETWWEILRNYESQGAKIIIKEGSKIVDVKYKGSLIEKIIDVENSDEADVLLKKNLTGSNRIFFQENNRGEKYYVKEMKLIHFTKTRPGLSTGVFLQRKGMKIGEIIRKDEVRESLKSKFYGYVILEEGAESVIQKAENEVHYGFNFNVGHAKKLRTKIKEDLIPFFDRFTRTSSEGNSDAMMDNYRAITSILSQLGTFSNFGGHKSSRFTISWVDISLPNNERSVNYVDEIGPIKINIKNNENSPFMGKALLSLFSTGPNGISQEISSKSIEIDTNSSEEVVFNPFIIPSVFQNGMIFLKASFSSQGIEKTKKTFALWLNTPVPDGGRDQIMNLYFESPKLPNKNSLRVDLGEEIKELGMMFSSNISKEINANISIILEHRNEEHNSWEAFHKIFDEDMLIQPFKDYSIGLDNLEISEEIFGFFENKERTKEKRKVRFFVLIKSNELLPELAINRGQKIVSSNRVQFYVGIDSGGNSPFKRVVPFDGLPYEKSKYSGTRNSGYTCEINQLFHEYKTIENIQDQDLKVELMEDYQSREIIKQAVMLCLENQDFEGPLFNEESSEVGEGNGIRYADLFRNNDFILDIKRVCNVTEELINKLSSQC